MGGVSGWHRLVLGYAQWSDKLAGNTDYLSGDPHAVFSYHACRQSSGEGRMEASKILTVFVLISSGTNSIQLHRWPSWLA